MKTSRICTLIVLLSLMGLGLAGLATAGKLQQELVQESAVEQIMQRGILKVGMSTFVPWAMKDKTGKLIYHGITGFFLAPEFSQGMQEHIGGDIIAF